MARARSTSTTASGAFGHLALVCALASCFPRNDLSGYSGGESGNGGTNQISEGRFPDAGDRDSGTMSSEEIDDMVPISPQDSGAPLGAGGTGTLPADAGELGCEGSGEFESVDGQSCYLLSTDLTGWIAGRDACRAWGGDLVKIETPAEHEFLTSRVSVDVWIGANDRDQEGDFEWADGETVTFFNWSMDQPDNFQGQENCVEIRALDELWNDRPCGGDPQAYLCER